MSKTKKGTFLFKNTIQKYMDSVAKEDEVIKEKMNSPNKNIDDCVTFILSTVQKSGNNGFTDDEVFGLALHYYDEEDIDIGKLPGNLSIVVNHEVKLTDSEIAEAKQKAIDQVIYEQKQKMTKKKDSSKPVKKKDSETLF